MEKTIVKNSYEQRKAEVDAIRATMPPRGERLKYKGQIYIPRDGLIMISDPCYLDDDVDPETVADLVTVIETDWSKDSIKRAKVFLYEEGEKGFFNVKSYYRILFITLDDDFDKNLVNYGEPIGQAGVDSGRLAIVTNRGIKFVADTAWGDGMNNVYKMGNTIAVDLRLAISFDDEDDNE